MSQSMTTDQESKIKEIQANWKAASTAQFVSLYREGFKLPEIELEDLEDGLIEEESFQRKIVIQLLVALLKGINPKTKFDNWEASLQKLVQKRFVAEGHGTHDPYLINIEVGNRSDSKTEPPVNEGKELKGENSEDQSDSKTEGVEEFKEDSLDNLLGLDQQDSTAIRSPSDFWKFEPSIQVDIIYFLCLMRVDRSDAVEVMKKMDAGALRAAPLGSDKEGNEYWYFYGTRLYKQTPAPLKKERSWEDEWQKQKEKTFKKRRPGRPPKRMSGRPRKSDGESDELDGTVNNRSYMNIDQKSRWSVVCNVIEDWFEFAEKFKNSESQCEKDLFTVVQENFLPALCDIYEEKERRMKQKIKELIPKRTPVVTRMATRKYRTPTHYASELSDLSNSSFKKEEVRKSRADRLEERNRRVSERHSRSSRNKDKYYNEDSDEISDDFMDTSNEDEYVQKYYPLYSDGDDIKPAVMKLMSEVRLHKDAWPFINPVKKEEAPGYYEIISQPIDLSMITQKLVDGRYQNLDGLDADFRKLIMNCRLYNGEHSGPTKMVNSVYKMFTKGLEKIFGIKEEPEEDYYSDEPVSKSSRCRVTLKSGKRSNNKRKKRKVCNTDAIEALSHATEMSLKKQDQNNSFESLQYSGFQQNSSFSDLKIIPIHSNPSEIVKKLSSNESNQNEKDVDNNNESSSHMEKEAGNSLKDFDLCGNSNSLPSPADYGYFESPNNGDNSDESVFTDKDSSENANSQSEEVNKMGKKSDHESGASNSESGIEIQHRTQRNSSSSSEGLVHSMANILDECGNQNMTNLTSGFNRESVYSANNHHLSSSSKSPHSSHSDSSTPEQVRMIPKDSPPIQNSIVDKHVPLLQPRLNIQSDFGSFSSGNYETSTVDASVLGFSSFSTVPSRVSPPSILQPDHKQTTPPMQLPNPVASITTHMSPSSHSQVVAPSAVPQLHQNPVQILKPEPNKFPTVKVSLPPSTGEILVLPDKTDPNKMTFHLLAQPHANGNAVQPIQSYFDIRADRSSESSVSEKESSSTIVSRRTSPVIEPSPYSTASNGISMVPQPAHFSSLLKPATTFSNFSPNPTSSSNAPSYTSSFNPISTNVTNTCFQPTYQYVRPSNFNTLTTNYSPVIRQPNVMNSNIDNSEATPQIRNIFKTMNPPSNSVFSNYQIASKETKSKSISPVNKKQVGNVQKVTQVAASNNNILFNSSSMLTSSNGQYEFISVPQSGSRTQSSDRVIRTLPEEVASSSIPTYSNSMQNYSIASTALGTPLMYAQVNPNQPSQLINIPNYMFTNQNLFQHPMNPSIMNIQPFQVPTRPIISMDMSNR